MQTIPTTCPVSIRLRPSLAGAIWLALALPGLAAAQDSLAPPPPSFAADFGRLPSPPGMRWAEPAPKVAAGDAAEVPDKIVEKRRTTLDFPAGSDVLTPEAARTLDRIAARLLSNPAERLELHAHAPAGSRGEGAARRLSLSRALAVRAYLLDRGVEKRRLIVYAQGSRGLETAGPAGQVPPDADRVDLSVTP